MTRFFIASVLLVGLSCGLYFAKQAHLPLVPELAELEKKAMNGEYGSKGATNPDTANPKTLKTLLAAEVKCWDDLTNLKYEAQCFRFSVPENHNNKNGRTISFPVIRIAAPSDSPNSAVLHLGGGGPGAPLGLDDAANIDWLIDELNDFSLALGRDLYLMDPRGVGLSKPLLTCDRYVDNQSERFAKNLNYVEYLKSSDQDYFYCIDEFKQLGVDFNHYNSLSVAKDVELLRRAAKIDKWVLVGVSYSTRYAQLISTLYPESVEAMVLDSAVFPNLFDHHNYIENILEPINMLYRYCEVAVSCRETLPNFEARFWNLFDYLNRNPIVLEMDIEGRGGTYMLNGYRFLDAVGEGLYGAEIFEDIAAIVEQLEKRQTAAIYPYLVQHVQFLLDRNWGDVAASAHYCFESKPFTDIEQMKKLALQLPEGYIQTTALTNLNWPDYCDKMNVLPGDPIVSYSTKTQIPTLFLHGGLDTVTRLRDVREQIHNFKAARLKVFDVAHSVLTADACAEKVAAKFLENSSIVEEQLSCD